MRLRHIKNSEIDIYNNNYVVKNYNDYKGTWNKVFSNNNKIELEIGMGKGNFLISKALDNSSVNYIGIEKYPSVLLKAIDKLENMELKNIKFIVMDASFVSGVFDKEISTLYLNFSDPWPKKKHEKRRLTSKNFLEQYDSIFKDKCIIEMKTDNNNLFEYSLDSFKEYGYEIVGIDRNVDSKYKTEYEKKFFEKGNNINYVKIRK